MKKLLLLLCLIPSFVYAANVYIDPSATYNGDGTEGVQAAGAGQAGAYNTWSSVSFSASDDYYQKCGTSESITGYLNIVGITATSGNRMVIGAYYLDGYDEVVGTSGARPIINQSGHTDGYRLMYLSNSDYLHFKDLDLRGGYKMISIRGGVDHLLVEDCTVGKGTYQYAIYAHSGTTGLSPSNYGVIRDCVFDSDIGNSGAAPNDEGGTLEDGIFLKPGHSYWEIYDNEFIDWPHAAISITSYDGYDNSEDAETAYNLIHDNHIYRVATGSYDYCRGLAGIGDAFFHHNQIYNNHIEDVTIRSQFGGHNNRVYHNIFDGVSAAYSTTVRAGGIHIMGSDWESTAHDAVENIVHNNVFINTAHAGISIGSDTVADIKDNVFSNNIIYNCGNGFTGDYSSGNGSGIWVNPYSNIKQNEYYNNIIYNSTYSDVVLWKLYSGMCTVTEFNALNGTDGNVIVDNLSGNPLLNNISGNDFTLQTGSPAIDAGAWLTTITSSTGSGTSFVVDNANFFSDGYGYFAADEIQLESESSTVTISGINYTTNTITVDESVSWTIGDGVSLAFNGDSPDIGAYEYVGSNPPGTSLGPSISGSSYGPKVSGSSYGPGNQ